MQPPTPTKNHRPATKARTFVLANGALLAEQEVIEYQQTNYEILRFVHQDASGTGVQQTLANGTLAIPNGRTAEYDAMGRNVADPGPYVTLNTQVPSENGSGIDLFGNGEGYRPGRSTYKVNGFVVPESTFMMYMGSFTFDLIQVAAQMSRMQFLGYTLRYGNGDETFAGFDEARAISRMEDGETLVRNWLVNDSWSVITMIQPVQDEFVFQLWYSRDEKRDDGVLARIKAVLFDEKALSVECTKAFEDLGATPIREQLAQKNLTFVTEAVFMDPRADGFWSPDQQLVDGMRSTADEQTRRVIPLFGPPLTGIIEAGDIAWAGNGGLYQGGRYIGITYYGLNEVVEHFSVTLIHAMLHSGGKLPKPGSATDLHYLGEKYDKAIEACQRNKPRVPRAGGN